MYNTKRTVMKNKYPNWLYIEPIASKILFYIYENHGVVKSVDEYERIFEKYVSKYFTTWDNFSCCMSSDLQYSPVLLCAYAEKQGINPNYPIRVMREIIKSIGEENLKTN